MNPTVNVVVNLFLRWAHVVAGITWIGHLYFFNWVNAQFQAKVEGPTKRAINPELLPRALFWFRWGAAWTWITGILLLGLIYYHGRAVFDGDYMQTGNPWLWLAIVIVLLAVGFVLYNAIMKMIANKVVAAAICLVLFAAVYAFLEFVGHFSGRSLYIHAGGIFGTMMAANVWMVIWPNQKKIISALKAGTPLAPDSPEVKIAGLRSRHNTFMSVPLVFLMVSNHYGEVFGSSMRDAILAGIIILGFIATRMLYNKAGKVQGM
ncbi:MAG: urate hydroxylase PuuD [Acidobacteriota bacterium]|nr:urate hydroxylase PuuD [Acidobacteriota bacterium]